MSVARQNHERRPHDLKTWVLNYLPPHLSHFNGWVAVCLADYANKQGRNAYPSAKTLASEKGRCTPRSVQRAFKALEEAGVIARDPEAPERLSVTWYFPGYTAYLETFNAASRAPDSLRPTVAPYDTQSHPPCDTGSRESDAGSQTYDSQSRSYDSQSHKPLRTNHPINPREEPTSRARERASLTGLRLVDELDAEDLERVEEEARAAQEYERKRQEEERKRYLEAGRGGVSREEQWNLENAPTWYQQAARAGLMPNRMPQAAMTRSAGEDYSEAAG